MDYGSAIRLFENKVTLGTIKNFPSENIEYTPNYVSPEVYDEKVNLKHP